MITEVLLILLLYPILFFICWRFLHLIKMMAIVGDILNNNKFFGDVVDTPKEGIEQHKKREKLRNAVDKGKFKIRDVHKLHQDIENDPIIKDQMTSLGCLLVCTFGNLLALI